MSSINDIIKQAQDNIDKYGFSTFSVFADEDFPTFSYTVGLTGHGLPELVIVGIPPRDAQHILLEAAQRQVDRAAFVIGERIAEIFPGFSVLSGDVSPQWARRLCNLAQVIADGPVRALQLIWPDEKGLFPGEQGYNDRYLEIQPLLSADPAPNPEEGAQRPPRPSLH